jgi:hypothetical protein
MPWVQIQTVLIQLSLAKLVLERRFTRKYADLLLFVKATDRSPVYRLPRTTALVIGKVEFDLKTTDTFLAEELPKE